GSCEDVEPHRAGATVDAVARAGARGAVEPVAVGAGRGLAAARGDDLRRAVGDAVDDDVAGATTTTTPVAGCVGRRGRGSAVAAVGLDAVGHGVVEGLGVDEHRARAAATTAADVG